MVHLDDKSTYEIDVTPPWWGRIGMGVLNHGAIVLMAIQRLARTGDGGCLPSIMCGFAFDMKRATIFYLKPREFDPVRFENQLVDLQEMLTSMGPRPADG